MTLLWVKDDGGGWGFWADCCKPELTAVDSLAPPLRGSRHILQLTQDCVRWCALVLHPSDEDLSLGTPGPGLNSYGPYGADDAALRSCLESGSWVYCRQLGSYQLASAETSFVSEGRLGLSHLEAR